MYIRPFTPSRMITVRLPPPVLPAGISASTSPHSSSVKSLGYRNLLRSKRARFLLVHIGDPSSNQATTLESQMIHMIQELFGQTLRDRDANEAAPEDRGTSTVNQLAQHPASASLVKQKKTIEELAAMIHQDLSQLEDCPKQGVKVTVYGLNPWNSLLTFGVDAGLAGLFLCGRCFDLSALRKVSFNGLRPYFSFSGSKRP